MSAAVKCELCCGYYDRERFKVDVRGPAGSGADADCCSVACVAALAEKKARGLEGLRTLERVGVPRA